MRLFRPQRFLYFLAMLFALAAPGLAWGQPVIDQVIAVVGGEPILRSELEVQVQQIKATQPGNTKQAECWVLDQFLQRKLMLWRAKMDSLKVSDEQVEGEMDRRMAVFVQQFGSEEKLEEYYNKSIPELKGELQELVKEQLLIDQQQNKIQGSVQASPQDVREFFAKIPEDSLPYYNTELELSEIVMYPKTTAVEKQAEIDKLRQIRQDILSGKSSFCTMAILYSEDPGSAVKCGDLGMQRADLFVPEFSAVALSLKKDSISDVVETKFGYHIIKLVSRKGDMINASHILRKPKVSDAGIRKAINTLDSLRTQILKGTVSFESAAYGFSQNDESRNRGGVLVDPGTTASRIPMDRIDAELFAAVDNLKPGDISRPLAFKTEDGSTAYRIVYLRSKTQPHKANLKEDYARMAEMTLSYKKALKLDDWVNKNIPKVYLNVDPRYDGCEVLKRWHKGQSFVVAPVK